MKNGKPALRKPPASREMDPALANLLKVDGWTQQPAEKAASDAGLVEGRAGESAALESITAGMTETMAVEHAPAPAPAKLQPGTQVMPWEQVTEIARPELLRPARVVSADFPRQSVTYRLPLPLVQALSWLGSTSYGENATSIVIQALEDEVNARLAAMGKPLIQRSTPDRKLRKTAKP